MSFVWWAHTCSIERFHFQSPPPQEIFISPPLFPWCLDRPTQSLGEHQRCTSESLEPCSTPWNPAAPLEPCSLLCRRLAVLEWGCCVLQGHETPTLHFSEYSHGPHLTVKDTGKYSSAVLQGFEGQMSLCGAHTGGILFK